LCSISFSKGGIVVFVMSRKITLNVLLPYIL
jgi:hypothetical protein